MRVVVALGGHALEGLSDTGGVGPAARQLADLITAGHEVVITHGNGPQVGELLLDQESRGPDRDDPEPLDVLVAMTQAQLGYLLQRDIEDELVSRGDHTDVVTIVTEVEVAADDPAFDEPSKPVGPTLADRPDDGEPYRRTGEGWRRLVPSPDPLHLIERRALGAMVNDGIVPICAGGGGVPVIRRRNRLIGVEAVIDKDLSSALVASDLGADALVVLTDVPHVMLHHGTSEEEPLDEVTTGDARALLDRLEAGTMRPKVLAGIRAAEAGMRAVIGALEDAGAVVEGEVGTTIVPGPATGRWGAR